MPRKVRDLINDLEKAGFVNRGGKGNHRNFIHPKVAKTITISGKGCANGIKGGSIMREGSKYVKIVEWSEDDGCFIGSCPELFYGGCHGENEHEVFDELCQIVEETIDIYRKEGKPIPSPLSGKEFVNALPKVV